LSTGGGGGDADQAVVPVGLLSPDDEIRRRLPPWRLVIVSFLPRRKIQRCLDVQLCGHIPQHGLDELVFPAVAS
jgi:hypothetical protein